MTRNRMFLALLLICVLFSGYTITKNLIVDPNADEFLSLKGNVTHLVSLPAWLTVMHVHVIVACLALLSGLANFFTNRQKKFPNLHRYNGYFYVTMMILTNFSSGYLAPTATGGKATSIAFNLVNIVWLVVTIIALVQIKKRDFTAHRNWMIRSFVFCFTNPVLHSYCFILHEWLGIDYTVAYTAGVYGSLVTNLLAAELVIRYGRWETAQHHNTPA